MLEIRFQDIQVKGHAPLLANRICLMNQEPVLLEGDAIYVSAFFKALKQKQTCTYWQDQKELNYAQIQANTTILKQPAFSRSMRVLSYLKREMKDDEVDKLLSSLPFSCSETTRFKDISEFDRTCLYFKLALRQGCKFIVLQYDARNCDNDQIEVLKTIVTEAIEKGCYVLMEKQAERLLPHIIYNIQRLPTSYITNFVEESLLFPIPPTKHKQIKRGGYLQLLPRLLVLLLFSICSLCFAFMLITYANVSLNSTQFIEKKIAMMEENEVYPVILHKDDGDNQFQYFASMPYRDEEQAILDTYAKELPIYPLYEATMYVEKPANITITKNGEEYDANTAFVEERYFTISSYNAQTKKHLLMDEEEDVYDETIYLNSHLAEGLFPDIDIHDATMKLTIHIPVYSFTLKMDGSASYQGTPNHQRYDFFTKDYTFEAPVKVKNSTAIDGGFTIADSTFQKAYAMVALSQTNDETAFLDEVAKNETFRWRWNVNDVDMVEDIRPFHPYRYLYLANEQTLDAAKNTLQKVKYSSVFLSIYDQSQEELTAFKESQTNTKDILFPFMRILGGAMIVCSIVAFALKYRFCGVKDQPLQKRDTFVYIASVAVGVLLCLGFYWLFHQEAIINFVLESVYKLLLSEAYISYEDSTYYYQIVGVLYQFFYPTQINMTIVFLLVLALAFIVALYQLPSLLYRYRKHHA